MNNSFNVHEIIQMAVNIEREGYEFYAKVAKNAVDEKSRAVFIILAEQEKKHIETFSALLETVNKTNQAFGEYMFDENVYPYFKALTEHQVFSPARESDAAHMTSAIDAIKEGLNAEKNSILFYNELLRNAVDEEVKTTLASVIDEEKRHVVDLNSLLKTL